MSAAFALRIVQVGEYPHSPGGEDRFGLGLAAGDFNGDGFDDLAVGAPGDDCAQDVWDCGSVQVRFGWPVNGLSFLRTVDPRLNPFETANASEEFGMALAAGDLDGDGYDDLAVGVPLDLLWDGAEERKMGAVHLFRGRPNDLGQIDAIASDVLAQRLQSDALPGTGRDYEYFGWATAFGDFNGDGRDDLAIGAPQDSVTCSTGGCWSGTVSVVDQREDVVESYILRPGHDGLPGIPASDQQFGRALATGDFNGDGYDDLAIGAPKYEGSGAVLIVFGSPFSLIFRDHQWLDQATFGESRGSDERFGEALAAGDFDGDGRDDLAIGSPREEIGGSDEAGLVLVAFGTGGGLSTANRARFERNSLFGQQWVGIDRFGQALAAGDFDDDGFADLAIGFPGLDQGSGGGVAIVAGDASRFFAPRARLLYGSASAAGMIPSAPAAEPQSPNWGTTLTAADFDGNGFADLAIGGPFAAVNGSGQAGAVAVLFGQLFVDGFERGSRAEWTSNVP